MTWLMTYQNIMTADRILYNKAFNISSWICYYVYIYNIYIYKII